MKKKNLSLSGDLPLGILSMSVIDFKEMDVYIYIKDISFLGIYLEDRKFIGGNLVSRFVRFQDGISFELKSGKRVALYRVGNQLEIRGIK